MDELLEIRRKFAGTKQMTEEIFLTLDYAIANGILKPGDRLHEENLAKLFDVSRTPLREAIKRLEFGGYVTHDLKYGFRVTVLSPYECVELIQAIEFFRQMATRIAAESITKPYLLRLEANMDALSKLPFDEVDKRLTLNEEFHSIIVESIGNSVLNDSYNALIKKYWLVYRNKVQKMTYTSESQKEHLNILKALAAHNPDEAWKTAVIHSGRSSLRIKEILS
jgi:DNA-binding GntR family transcriptional regulator